MTNEQVKTQLMIMGFIIKDGDKYSMHDHTLYNKDINCEVIITIPADTEFYYNFTIKSPNFNGYRTTDSYVVVLDNIKELFKEKEDDKQRT